MNLDALTKDRARRALTHGRGIDGVLYALLAVAGIGMVGIVLVAGLRTAETQAERDAGQSSPRAASKSSEIGEN